MPRQGATLSAQVIPTRRGHEDSAPFVPRIVGLPLLSSAPQDVNHRENNDPHRIDKVPVQRKHCDACGLTPTDTPSQAKKKHNRQHEQARGYVKAVQTDKRVVGGSKKVGGDSQPAFVDQPTPFLTGPVKKRTAQGNREEPQTEKCVSRTAFQEFRREVDRQAARQKANGVENRRFKHFARRWSGKTLPCVKEIRHYENGEDRRLGGDETRHSNFSPIGKNPCRGRLMDRSCH